MASNADRRYYDVQRQQALRISRQFEGKLLKYRGKEITRALRHLKDNYDTHLWESTIGSLIDETAYLPEWHRRLTLTAGIPVAVSTAKRLLPGVEPETGIFEQRLSEWSKTQMGERIVSVQGTLKETLRLIIRQELANDYYMGVEKLSRSVASRYNELALWQVRRIAQTECLTGLSEAANEAAESLAIHYNKEWMVSGLANTRESHLAMDGVMVGENDIFEVPADGDVPSCLMRFPRDTMYNPPAGQIINCACACNYIAL